MFLGRDGFVWWVGVVEENEDPLLLCRVKVRIFGYHPAYRENKVSTADLPWATVLLAPNASLNYSRIALGEWVMGFFMDATEAQEPVVFGVLPTALTNRAEGGGLEPSARFGRYGTAFRTFPHITQSENPYPPNGSNDDDFKKLLQRKSFISESGHVINMVDNVDEPVIAIGQRSGNTSITLDQDEIVIKGTQGTYKLVDVLKWITSGYTDPNGGKIGTGPPPPPPPGGGGKIICTKLYELGFLPEDVYNADQEFGERLVEAKPDIYYGYIAWAQVVVDWMEGNGPQCMFWLKGDARRTAQQNLSIAWARKIATPWALHMAYVMGTEKKDSLTGKVLMGVGAPICKVIGWWQRKFGKSEKEPGLFKGFLLWGIFAILRLVVAIMSPFERKR